jgi:hypothetical protein
MRKKKVSFFGNYLNDFFPLETFDDVDGKFEKKSFKIQHTYLRNREKTEKQKTQTIS